MALSNVFEGVAQLHVFANRLEQAPASPRSEPMLHAAVAFKRGRLH